MKDKNLPLKQHKTNTTGKIKKIKRIKIKVPKEHIINSDHSIKSEENRIKKNELYCGKNSIEQIKQRISLIREDLINYVNEMKKRK